MNFDEAARRIQMTPPPASFLPPSTSFEPGDPHYIDHTASKQSLHLRSDTISDEGFMMQVKAMALKNPRPHFDDEESKDHQPKRSRSNKKKSKPIGWSPSDNSHHAFSISDTYDDDMDTETEDSEHDHSYDRSNSQTNSQSNIKQTSDMTTNSNSSRSSSSRKPQAMHVDDLKINTKMVTAVTTSTSTNVSRKKQKRSKKHSKKHARHSTTSHDKHDKQDKHKGSKDIIASRKRAQSRPNPGSHKSVQFLSIPDESDDNFDVEDIPDIDRLTLPDVGPKMHLRSYSESNIQKAIQKNQWPSSPSSEESFECEDSSVAESPIYSRYVMMKKKYKKQRRISRQFQDAITVIQDDNEDVMHENEEQIRERFEREYEMKLIELEHEKLNTTINIEDKMKQVLLRNDELMQQNQQLQQQVAAQVAMIQEQQQIALQHQRQFVAMSAHDSPVSTNHSPMATLTSFPNHAMTPTAAMTRMSSAASNSTHTHPHAKVLGLTPRSSHGEHYTLNDDVASVNTDVTFDAADMYGKFSVFNMEPAVHYPHSQISASATPRRPVHQKKYSLSKKTKKLKEMERRLYREDEEVVSKLKAAKSSPWDRFLELLTPSFCSCSPAVPIQAQAQRQKLLDSTH